MCSCQWPVVSCQRRIFFKLTTDNQPPTTVLRLFSCQTSKVKGAATLRSSNDPGVTAPKNLVRHRFCAVRLMFRERERRSRSINLVVPDGSSPPIWADNSCCPYTDILLHFDPRPAAYRYGRRGLQMLQIYVLNFVASKLSPKIFPRISRKSQYWHRSKMLVKHFFENFLF